MPNTRRGSKSPLPSPQFPKQVAQEVFPPFVGTLSGEFVGSRKNIPLGIARFKGRVTDVYMSVGSCGYDVSSEPSGEVDVLINGVSCLTTKPYCRYVSGETSASQKTTFSSAADTGVRAAVVNEDANSFEQGDVLSWEFTYGGDANPDTAKMANVCVLVEVEPSL